MAELKASTSIGGNLVWHSGNLRFDTQGETIRFGGYKIYTERNTPHPHELGNGASTSSYTKYEADTKFAPSTPNNYVNRSGGTMLGKLFNTANDIEIQGENPRLTLTDINSSNRKWFIMNDSGSFSLRENSISVPKFTLSSVNDGSLDVFVKDFRLNSKNSIADNNDGWLTLNSSGHYVNGTKFNGHVYYNSNIEVNGSTKLSTMTISGTLTGNNIKASEFQSRTGTRMISLVTDTVLRIGNSLGVSNTRVYGSGFDGKKLSIWDGVDRWVYNDIYHPLADKLSTERTVRLDGDATGYFDYDGSGDSVLTLSIKDDSHKHDERYYTKSVIEKDYIKRSEIFDVIYPINVIFQHVVSSSNPDVESFGFGGTWELIDDDGISKTWKRTE